MRVLVACEYSGRVRDAFRAEGHDAMSCDLLPTEVEGPHYQGDVLDLLEGEWDLLIAHPPCTFLTVAGLHWNARDPERAAKTEAALDFVRRLLRAPVRRIALENPVSCISSAIRPPDQTVQPYDFGEDASKRTCFWLKGLPKLTIDPSRRKAGRLVEWPRGSGRLVERWANQTDSGQNNLPPAADRWKERSRTYPGLAKAMAESWGRAQGTIQADMFAEAAE